ncbi:S24 family peptidase [Pantoea sp. 18069]|uniref:LexA family transcriptional regulator n=1 Tax=Pantoea sp. 18069 TaxID=2681415 RepID=UPI001F17733D|nr:S24 family peptidase [Pantoea sp. 18069]
MFKQKSNVTFNNALFSNQKISTMHPSIERLYQAAKQIRDITGQSAVARLLNESPQTVKNWETRGVSRSGALTAEATLGVRAAWLLAGDGEMLTRSTAPAVIEAHAPACPEDSVRIPLLANGGSMGPGNDVLDVDYVVGDLTLSSHWINQQIRPANIQELRFMHAHGESMAPTFSDGDVLLVDAGARDPSSMEGIYVLEVHSKTYIKRVRMRMDGSLEVSSDNANIKTVDVLNGDHEVRVIGRVVWAWNGRKL